MWAFTAIEQLVPQALGSSEVDLILGRSYAFHIVHKSWHSIGVENEVLHSEVRCGRVGDFGSACPAHVAARAPNGEFVRLGIGHNVLHHVGLIVAHKLLTSVAIRPPMWRR